MNRLPIAKRAQILGCLVEGNSIRATCRMTGAAKGTVIKLLADVGAACKRFHDQRVMMIETKRIQCDEIWSFSYAKDKNIPADMKGVFGIGDPAIREYIAELEKRNAKRQREIVSLEADKMERDGKIEALKKEIKKGKPPEFKINILPVAADPDAGLLSDARDLLKQMKSRKPT